MTPVDENVGVRFWDVYDFAGFFYKNFIFLKTPPPIAAAVEILKVNPLGLQKI